MYNSEQKIFIRRFRWLCNDHVTAELGYEQQMLQLRDMAKEAIELVPEEHRELFLHFAKGGKIKPGDPIKSAQYLSSLFSCTNSSGLSTEETRSLEAGGGVLSSPKEAEKLVNDALLKTAAEYALMIRQSLSQKAVAELLGVSTSRVRQRLDARSLYGVQADWGRVCPAWQFLAGQSLPNLDKVLAVLDPNLHPLTVQGFFQTPQPDLESDQHHRFLTPVEWLFAVYPVKPVVMMARDL